MTAKEHIEYTVMQPTGPSGIWSFRSGAVDYLHNGTVRQATDPDDDDELLFTVVGEPVMEQVDPVPPPTSYLAQRRVITTDWERVPDEALEQKPGRTLGEGEQHAN